MFPPANLDPQSTRWKDLIESSLEEAEKVQPRLDAELDALQRENNSVLNQVTSRVNAYYTSTIGQYPVFEHSVLMSTVFGGPSTTFSVSAPAAADDTVAETWVTAFTYNLPLPAASTVLGVRLNGAQFRIDGPSAYRLRFRWHIDSTNEGITTARWMSRHNFNLSEYPMAATEPSSILTNVSNRYAHYSGASVSTMPVSLQVSIQDATTRAAAVASQNITLYSYRVDGQPTYLDMMVTR